MNLREFQQRIEQAGNPIVVDFWAPWCVPCRVTKPVLEKLAQEYGDRVAFMPVDADASRDVLQHYHVIGIPTVLALRDGNLANRVTGARNEADYRLLFESLAEGKEVKLALPFFDRLLRLGAGMVFMLVGFSTGSWIAVVAGGLLAFLGVYDRCPVWRALTDNLRQK